MTNPIDEPGPSTRPVQSLALPAAPSRQPSRARSPNEPRPRSPNSQPVPYRSSSVQPQSSTALSTTSRKPVSASQAVSSVPTILSLKGKGRQESISTPSAAARPSSTRDVFDSSEPRGRSRHPPDISLPIPLRETPLIERNREIRSQATTRRRNSLEHRRRASESLGKSGAISTYIHPSFLCLSCFQHGPSPYCVSNTHNGPRINND